MALTPLLIAFSFMGFLKSLLFVLFMLTTLLLILIVLLQEPKGGGLSSAFGGAGAETFGVQTGGVNKFTSIVAGIFLLCAVLYAAIRPVEEAAPSDTDMGSTPEIGAPADGTGDPGNETPPEGPPSDPPPVEPGN